MDKLKFCVYSRKCWHKEQVYLLKYCKQWPPSYEDHLPSTERYYHNTKVVSLTGSYCGRKFSHVSQSFTRAHVCNLRLPTRVFSPSVLYHVFYVILLYIRRNYKSCIVHQALGSINLIFPNQEICIAPDMNFILMIYWYFDLSSGLILLSTNYFSVSLIVLEFPQVILIGFMVIQPKENLQFLSLDPFAFMCLYNWNPTRSHVSIIAVWYTE